MSLLLALALLAAPAADPTPEALALGVRLAETGSIAALLPTIVAKEREELVGEHPDWSDADKAALRTTADAVATTGIRRLMDAIGRAYAEKLSIDDLRALVAFNESPAAQRWRAATPAVMGEALAGSKFDFKADVRAAFCKQTGKGCAIS